MSNAPSSSASHPLRGLNAFGQSVWLDFLSRGMLERGDLARLIAEDGISGVTSNPAIFEKAIAGSTDYDGAIRAMARDGASISAIYERLTVEDVGRAADLLRPVYDRSAGRDGFVSLEVSPQLADDTDGTIAEARHLWAALNRPNVFIKVPGTRAGVPAIRTLTADGISINVTLLFAVDRYQAVAEAFISGLEARSAKGQPFAQVASVASFFLSRIDSLLDPQLEGAQRRGAQGGRGAQGRAAAVVGEVAIASAKLAYQHYVGLVASPRWKALAAKGACPQKLLWASTSTKNPAYSAVKYVEPLIGPDTINTMPMETVTAYRTQGQPASRIGEQVAEARATLAALPGLGIDLAAATDQLEREGVQKFVQPFETLMAAIGKKRESIAAT